MDSNILPLDSSILEEKIGYKFNNKKLLIEALTHTSYANEHKLHFEECNERLEFLGDSVLSIIVSTYLFTTFSSRMEGDLTKIRAALVCEKSLASFAKEIGLGDFLRLGKGEDKQNGRYLASITSDAFEAVLGAIYLDSNDDLKIVEKFLLPFVVKSVENLSGENTFKDYKTMLQQIIQQVEGEKLEYLIVSESGPDHDKTYEAAAMLNANRIGIGKGKSKRAAEQNAAKEALLLFGVDTNE